MRREDDLLMSDLRVIDHLRSSEPSPRALAEADPGGEDSIIKLEVGGSLGGRQNISLAIVVDTEQLSIRLRASYEAFHKFQLLDSSRLLLIGGDPVFRSLVPAVAAVGGSPLSLHPVVSGGEVCHLHLAIVGVSTGTFCRVVSANLALTTPG